MVTSIINLQSPYLVVDTTKCGLSLCVLKLIDLKEYYYLTLV